jgi:hypothetical protein
MFDEDLNFESNFESKIKIVRVHRKLRIPNSQVSLSLHQVNDRSRSGPLHIA